MGWMGRPSAASPPGGGGRTQLWEEGGFDRIEGEAAVALAVEVEEAAGESVLAEEVAGEETWVVGVDGHEDAGMPELPQGGLLDGGGDAEAGVGGEADAEGDAALRQLGEQLMVLNRADAVLDALRAEGLQGGAYGLGAGVLAGAGIGVGGPPAGLHGQ